MKKGILALVAATALVSAAGAQDLDTTTIVDQFTTGSRGNETGNNPGTGTSFASSTAIGSTEYADYNGADVTGGPIRYVNEYAGAAPESPVQTVGSTTHADRSEAFTIPANTRSGAASANAILNVADDGGTNNLIFGQSDDSDYYVEVDVYCPDESAFPAGTHNLIYVAVRAGRDGTTTDLSWTVDRENSYALAYNSRTLEVKAVQYQSGTTIANAGAYTSASWAQEFGSTTVTGNAWHTFKVEAKDNHVVFSVDGTTLADVTDSDVANGRAILGWREVTTAASGADEHPAFFDYLRAGPATITNVSEWSLY